MSYAGEIVPLSEMFFHEMPELGKDEQEVQRRTSARTRTIYMVN